MISIGHCPNSNGLQFYNPKNGTFVSSIDYKLQSHTTSGAFFGLKYQPGTFIHRIDESNSIFAPTFPLDTNVFVHTHSPPSIAMVIGIPSYTNPDVYTVAFKDGLISEYTTDLLNAASTPISQKLDSLLPTWIKGGANAMLFLHSMSKPHHGTLQLGPDNKSKEGISLTDLAANCQGLLGSGQLFRGHAKFRKVYNARNQATLMDCVLRHVPAHGLR
jgi:hypothetical protein